MNKEELEFTKKKIKSYKNFEDLFSNNKEFKKEDNKKLYYYGEVTGEISYNRDLIMKCAAYFYNNKMIIASRLDSNTDTGTKTGGAVGNYPPYTNYTGFPLQEKLLREKKAVEEKLLRGKKAVNSFKYFIEEFDNPVYNKINESSLNDNFKETIKNALKKKYTSIEYYVYDIPPYKIDENINKSIYKFTVKFRGIYNPDNKYLYYLKIIEDKEVSHVTYLDNGYLDEEETLKEVIEQPEDSETSRNATPGTQTALLQETENTKNIILLRDLIQTLVSLNDDGLKTFYNYKINTHYGGNKI